ncbi:Rossmann-like and DUF2520 domain-containing protein [Microbacterium sp. SS28]|uniref:Rossmann-like and DUF2520 domain-containing protein n=1 Tax=Microbacterium sp. SS28 TaxID=2919948 RepID=UPI001FA982DD|nr:Rossmann-like and DUF2520 domain-containing protein [Microbacterium sp. SS28]
MTPSSPSAPRAFSTISVVGAGRLGRVLSRALRAAGFTVHGPTGRGERVEPADVVLLCVPDDSIAAAAAQVAGAGRWIGHTSGATPLAGLPVDFSLHPLQSFVGDEGPDAFQGIGCAIAGTSEEATDAALALATALGAHPFTIADPHRAAYHAAASIASNFLVTLEDAAERIAGAAGLSPADARELLAPLVRRTVENWASLGPESALTGPVARGDEETLARQRAAVADAGPDLLPLFDVLTQHTRALAARAADAASSEAFVS